MEHNIYVRKMDSLLRFIDRTKFITSARAAVLFFFSPFSSRDLHVLREYDLSNEIFLRAAMDKKKIS